MSYEAAPATEILATCCAVCARPLLDAVSVEAGIGPECRRKHGYSAMPETAADWDTAAAALLPMGECGDAILKSAAFDSDARAVANKLVHYVAVHQSGVNVECATNALRALGFEKLARRISERLASVRITEDGADLLVVTPYAPETLGAWHGIRGASWDKAAKARRIPAIARGALWTLLRKHFAGHVGTGPKGVFRIA